MSGANALLNKMRRLLASLRHLPPAVDHDTADRLLTGRLDPADAPPGYDAVVRLLAAATAPASPDELAGEEAVMAEFVATAGSRPATRAARRSGKPSRLLRVKAAAAIVAAALSIGGVAAAATTGLLGKPARPVAPQAPSSSGVGPAGHAPGGAAGTGLDRAHRRGLCRAWQADQGNRAGSREDSAAFRALAAAAGGADKIPAYCKAGMAGDAATRERDHGTGPNAADAAKDGLCRAWLAGKGDQRGKKEDSTAFQNLAKAAGGADKIPAYCKATKASGSADQGRQRRPPPTTSPAPPTEPPPGGGQGQGQGDPPTTG
jgi:hypothetical protein